MPASFEMTKPMSSTAVAKSRWNHP